MRERHSVDVLLAALLAALLVEAASLGALLLVFGALRDGWWSGGAAITAAAFAAGLGVAYGVAEVVARRRGVVAGVVALTLAWPLPCTFGAYAFFYSAFPLGPRGQLEAIEALWPLLLTIAPWRPALVLGGLALALHGPLLLARVRGRDVPVQVAAMALGAAAWSLVAITLGQAWLADLRVEAWECALLLVARVTLTPCALAVSDVVAGAVVRRLRGAPPEPAPVSGPPLATRRRVAVALGLLLGLIATLALGRRAPEPVALSVLRLHALRGPAQRLTLARSLHGFALFHEVGEPRWLLGTIGWLDARVAREWLDRDRTPEHELANELVCAVAREGHGRAMPALVTLVVGPHAKRGEAEAAALALRAEEPLIRRGAEGGDPAAMRALATLLEGRGVFERDAALQAEGVTWLVRASETGDAAALLLLAADRPPAEAVELARRARRVAGLDPAMTAWAAGRLEAILDVEPSLRAPQDAVSGLTVLDAAGRPLDGAVALELSLPQGEGDDPWSGYETCVVTREARAGRAELAPEVRLLSASYARTAERVAAGIEDGVLVRGPPGAGPSLPRELRFTLAPPEAYGDVVGVVHDADGRPLPDARVTLAVDGVETPRPLLATCDAAGRFVFASLPLSQRYDLGLVVEWARRPVGSNLTRAGKEPVVIVAPRPPRPRAPREH
jgi:hypothetical protein